MTNTTPERTEIIGGVDTHQDLHTAAIVSTDGAVLGSAPFSTTAPLPGDAALVLVPWRVAARGSRVHGDLWSRHHTPSGLVRRAGAGGDRSGPGESQPGAKTTPWTRSPAEAARTGTASRWPRTVPAPWSPCGQPAAMKSAAPRCRQHDRCGAREVRDQVRNLTRMQRLRTCAAWRPDAVGYRDPAIATKLLKSLARRILQPRSPNWTGSSFRWSRNWRPACLSSKEWESPTPASCS